MFAWSLDAGSGMNQKRNVCSIEKQVEKSDTGFVIMYQTIDFSVASIIKKATLKKPQSSFGSKFPL